MTLCDNPETYPRGRVCNKCPLGKRGQVGKIIIALENSGNISDLAGNIWLGRGGGQSSNTDQKSGYVLAVKQKTTEVCKKTPVIFG